MLCSKRSFVIVIEFFWMCCNFLSCFFCVLLLDFDDWKVILFMYWRVLYIDIKDKWRRVFFLLFWMFMKFFFGKCLRMNVIYLRLFFMIDMWRGVNLLGRFLYLRIFGFDIDIRIFKIFLFLILYVYSKGVLWWIFFIFIL